MKELSTKGMFFNDLDQAERDTLVAVAILQIMHAQPRFDASPNQDGGNVISVYYIWYSIKQMYNIITKRIFTNKLIN